MNMVEPRYHDNLGQRSPCLLVLDLAAGTGASAAVLRSTAIESLNEGLASLRDGLGADPVTQQKVQLSVIEAGGRHDDARVLLDWVDASDFVPPVIVPGRTSHLAQAMRLALGHVEQHKQTLRHLGITYTRPWIMVVSSGAMDEPRVIWDGVAKDCRQAERDKRCIIFPIVLDGADSSALRQMSTARVAKLSVENFTAYFRWLSAGLASTSRSAPGVSVALPSPSAWATFGK